MERSVLGLMDSTMIIVAPNIRLRGTGSCKLLYRMTMMGRIPFSFTNFITTPELSGPFYISPDIYHTQIAVYSLVRTLDS